MTMDQARDVARGALPARLRIDARIDRSVAGHTTNPNP
jgi:hypothetical protein